jgi:hypothetical protein
VAPSHDVLLAALAVLERAVAALGVAVRTEDKSLADVALQRDVAMPPGASSSRSLGASRHCERASSVASMFVASPRVL